MIRRAVITGVAGQDGWYTAQCLLAAGHEVVGLSRRSFEAGDPAIPPGVRTLIWVPSDQSSIEAILAEVRPTEFYNFAALSSGQGMFDTPVEIGDVNGLAVTRILEAIRAVDPTIRFCQASSSEMFGDPLLTPQTEQTPFNPRSPYGAAKLYAHSMIRIYRERYNLFATSAMLFNHESPRRSDAFVTQKIATAVARIRLGLDHGLSLGNLDARRDWGFAGDYVEAMARMLAAEVPGDYIIATGATHSVREFCEIAFRHLGLDYRKHVSEDPQAFRPSEALQLVGDPSKAAAELGWRAKTSFEDLVRMMVDAALERWSGQDAN